MRCGMTWCLLLLLMCVDVDVLLWWCVLLSMCSYGDVCWCWCVAMVMCVDVDVLLWWCVLMLMCCYGDVCWCRCVAMVMCVDVDVLLWWCVLMLMCCYGDVCWCWCVAMAVRKTRWVSTVLWWACLVATLLSSQLQQFLTHQTAVISSLSLCTINDCLSVPVLCSPLWTKNITYVYYELSNRSCTQE